MSHGDTELRHKHQDVLGSAYRLERELRGGGMSRVFVADDTTLGRKVVVKVLARAMAMRLISASLLTCCSVSALATACAPVRQGEDVTSSSAPLPTTALSAEQSSVYTVVARELSPVPRFFVRALIRMSDDTLRMITTRPGDIPEILRQGWPALVSNLRVVDESGAPLAAESAGAAGWLLNARPVGVVEISYDVDFTLVASHGWPAPRETAYPDSVGLLIVARSLFIGTSATGTATLRFILPAEWDVAGPWERERGDGIVFRAADFSRLANNAFVLTRERTVPLDASGFLLDLAMFGRWKQHRDLAEEVLRAHMATFTRLFEDEGDGHRYLTAFLVGEGFGGEAYLDSYVMQGDPDEAAIDRWGRLAGHELFHYWNGGGLRGADYIASQWFQEGVTEYYALLSMAQNGFIGESELLDQLSARLQASRGMTASLAAAGGRKNAAFYGRATFTALLLDLLLRQSTDNRATLGGLLRDLWQRFGRSGRPYTTAELYAASAAAAGTDISSFFHAHVESDEPLMANDLLSTVGLRVMTNSSGGERVEVDPAAPSSARARWVSIISDR